MREVSRSKSLEDARTCYEHGHRSRVQRGPFVVVAIVVVISRVSTTTQRVAA